MDSQPSGNNNELLCIETDNILFVLKGEKYGISEEATLKIDTFGKQTDSWDIQYKESFYLKEYSDYEVIIQSKNNDIVDFYHDNLNIRNKVTPITSKSNNLSGIINFKGDIGFTDILIKVNNKEELKITLEVYPSKISYKEDYRAILNDVNEEIYNLAYGFLARTYLGSEINNRTNNVDTEFYSILNYVFDNLKKAIDIILLNPHHELQKESKVVKYHSIRKCSNETIKYLEKRPYLMNKMNNKYLPSEALIVNKVITTNTNENRFLKFMLLKIIEKIDKFIYKFKKLNYKDNIVISNLSKFKKEINRRINTSFLRNIPSEYNEANLSLVFSMASGYKELYKYYLMLQKGLTISSNIFSISIKELSLLYEYWCFIKINSILEKKYKLITTDFLKINRNGINISLTKGVESSLTYENPKTQEKFKVYYNSTKASKTVSQKPDNILSMHKDGSVKSYEFIFDAKYKIDRSEEYINKYKTIGPKEEDINTMHRYRDAIVHKYKKQERARNREWFNDNFDDDYSSINNCIFGAFVLFPYDDEEEFKKNKFYKSIEEVNIGAIPFLPSTTKLMEEFLDELVNESSYSTFERALEPINKEEYLKDEYFNNRNVLVGALKDKKQLKVNLAHNFYHIPKKNVDLIKNNIKFIALAQSKKIFSEDAGIIYYGKVKSINLLKRHEIIEIPKVSDELYYKFEVEEWIQLDKKIEVKGYQVRRNIYTTYYLLKNAHIVTELCIRNKEEFRLWKELNRFNEEVETKVDDNNVDKVSKVSAFTIDDIGIVINSDRIISFTSDREVSVNRDEFRKKPRECVLKLLENIG